MKLYTKTGDAGETGLIGGSRVGKDDPRVESYGRVDELNASIGCAVVVCEDEAWHGRLQLIQDRLFSLGAELATPKEVRMAAAIEESDVTQLEGWIDEVDAEVAPLRQFVLPGGCELAARLHRARTDCRRAERGVVALARCVEVANGPVKYLNRLSDLLFAWARLANVRAGVADITWTAPKRLGSS